MQNDLVSVIVPTYNRPTYLPEAIESVLNQTYPDIEIIVVDDGSDNDGERTKEALKPYMDRLTYIYHFNQGIGATINKGLSISKGEFIQRLDDDDVLAKEKIGKSVDAFHRNPKAGIVVTGCHVVDESGNCISTNMPLRYPRRARALFMLMAPIFTQVSAMVRKSCHDDVGLYRTDILSEDFEMWVRIAQKYDIEIVEEPLALYRRHDENITRNTERLERDTLKFMQHYLEDIPMDELIPGIRSKAHGYALKASAYLINDGSRIRTGNIAKEKLKEASELAPNDPLIKLWELTLAIHGNKDIAAPADTSGFGEFQAQANTLVELINDFQELKKLRLSPESQRLIDFRRRYGMLKNELIRESFRRAING